MTNISRIIALLLLGISTSYAAQLSTMPNFNTTKYQGRWYEIAAIPNSFQQGCSCSQANYNYSNADDKIDVKNVCLKKEKWDEINTIATPTASVPSKWRVKTFWFFKTDYWILYTDYQYALVSMGDSTEYLWILARDKKISNRKLNQLKGKAKAFGFNTDLLVQTQQNCN